MSPNKRIKNEYTTSEEESGDDYEPSYRSECTTKQKPGRKPKCFTKNALLARENRLKKKMYISSLEKDVSSLKSENKKLASLVENQSFLISDLKKQIKYFRSVIANSSDISNLIRNIHHTTGMSVSSSLDKNLSLKNVCVPKLELPIARKTAHPWEERNYPSYPTPESNYLSSSPDNALETDGLNDILNQFPLDYPMDIPEAELIGNIPFKEEIFETTHSETLNEHNYTTTIPNLPVDNDSLDNVGVCLHVSKHRVSLEFCSTCSDNATQSWFN